MAKIRLQRVAQQIKGLLSKVIVHELSDPRAGFITIVDVDVSADLKSARVGFSVLGSDAQKRTAQRALESARGYIQSRVGQQIDMKYTPVLSFHLDESVERDIAFTRSIDETVRADERNRVARTIRARMAAHPIPDDLIAEIDRVAGSEAFLEEIAGLLTGLLEVDTTSRADLSAVRESERRCLDQIERALRETWGEALRIEYHPVEPDVADDELFTPPAYGSDEPVGRVYAERSNLTATLLHETLPPPPEPTPGPEDDEEEGEPPVRLRSLRLALNAHIDTQAPHRPPARAGDVVSGTGAVADKGPAVMVVAALRLLRHLHQARHLRLRNDLCAQFVIDRHPGGNGSLSLALHDPFSFDGVVVCEGTDLRVHTAHRGELGYRVRLHAPPDDAAEQAAAVVLALEAEVQALEDEGDHPLFPRPALLHHLGVIGPFGTQPDAPCDEVVLEVQYGDVPMEEIEQAVERAESLYREAHPGEPAAACSLDAPEGEPLRLAIRSESAAEQPGAAFRAAYVLRELSQLRAAGRSLVVRLAGHQAESLVLEGTLCFSPAHRLTTVQRRLTDAVTQAQRVFCEQAGLEPHPVVEVSFESRSRNAFARPADCELGVYAVESCKRAGIGVPPALGWNHNGDARLFAEVFLDRDVVVFGPGRPPQAPDEAENISLRDVAAGAKMLTYLLLEATGFAT